MTLTVLVTGATAGIGAAIAHRLVADGHRVIATGRRAERLEALKAELGERLLPFPLDVTDTRATDALPATLPDDWREIGVLVNNAGLARGMDPAQSASIANWDRMIAANVTGVVHLTRALLNGMIARGRGHIVNLGSVAGDFPYPGGNIYGATKAFVKQFTLGLKADLAGTNVRVTNIEPGMVGGTEFSNVRLGDDAKAAKVYEGADPLSPDDIADVVAWVITRPARVNISRVQVMPTCQGPGPMNIKRRG
jgi:3-hydroxy acid dehydrogenase/malonic semialdehyde reductase